MKKKVLVIKETVNSKGKVTHIVISKQSYILTEFGPSGKKYFKYGDFVLRSENSPEVMRHNDSRANEFKCSDGLYVRGNSGQCSLRSLKVPSKKWLEKMRAAVNAYNKSNGGCEGCFERKCNSCKF